MVEINRLKAWLTMIFDMKDLGARKTIWGIEINRDMKHSKL